MTYNALEISLLLYLIIYSAMLEKLPLAKLSDCSKHLVVYFCSPALHCTFILAAYLSLTQIRWGLPHQPNWKDTLEAKPALKTSKGEVKMMKEDEIILLNRC